MTVLDSHHASPAAQPPVISLLTAPLDRQTHRRADAGWLDELLARADTQVVITWRGRLLVNGPREAPQVARLSPVDADWRPLVGDMAVLGAVDGAGIVAAEVDAVDDPKAEPRLKRLGGLVDMRGIAPLLSEDDAALAFYARGLLDWNRRSRFCGVCGSPTTWRDAGHQRVCSNADCGETYFPRTDAAVIVLIHDGDRCLLARQPSWPAGMHSILAGFLEPGETLEDCVHREVGEEAGIEVADIRYHGSQPWPFPRSQMVGFTARAVTRDIRLDEKELEAAGWYTRDWLRALPADARIGEAPFALPPRLSIARRLVDAWLAGQIG